MRRYNLTGTFVLLIAAACLGAARGAPASGLKALYETHQWKTLYTRVQNGTSTPFYRGAMDVAFNQRPRESERLLLSVIRADPHSPHANEAFQWLKHLYFYRGQYRSLAQIGEKHWAAFPRKRAEEEAEIAGFRGLPNQIIESSRQSDLNHKPGSIFIPLSINGRPAEYFFDTGAWISCMSESEAKRLRLTVRNSSGKLGQMAGSYVGFRTAVAADVTIGRARFSHVSFAVFPDREEPWVDLPAGRRGIIGIPILVALGNLRWNKSAGLQIAAKSPAFSISRSNLMFDNDHLVIAAAVAGRTVCATVDTGALTTDLYEPFAEMFGGLVKKYGRLGTTEVRGVGHTQKFKSLTLPKLRIRIGGMDAVLSPAHVLLKPFAGDRCIGNFGMDLFRQASAIDINFTTMKLQLRSGE